MMPEELQKGITSNPELEFEHGNSRWNVLDNQKRMEISRRGFQRIEKSEILIPHPLKRYFRGQVCYNCKIKEVTWIENEPHGRSEIT
jgi:hypothetical protein